MIVFRRFLDDYFSISDVSSTSLSLSLFGFGLPNIISGNSNTAIGFSLFVVAMAAFNLVIDFDIIEQSADEGAPKYMEHFGSMALTITLVWLYIEILRLLMKLNSRR